MKNRRTIFIALGTLVLGLLIGWIFKPSGHQTEHGSHSHMVNSSEDQTWTCSMHPQIRQPDPGQCPICGMDLIPLNNESSDDENPMEIKMSPTAIQLANIQTSVILKKKPVKEVRINGKVKADERRIFSQSSHIPGRIEKLEVSFTGESVVQGQVLAYVYSPELVTAQEELFEANKIKEKQPLLFEATRGKLLNWKLTDQQIDEILLSGQIVEQFPVLADFSGVVLDKKVNLGEYVRTGQPLFEVADLSKVWVLLDVYESDMPWVKQGDDVNISIKSYPGESFEGRITFIDPVIDSKTRVAKARVELTNEGGRLKPDMFALGVINSPLDDIGEQLVVPKSAVMWTGDRSVVYVKHSDENGIGFVMRGVILGPGLGDSYIITSGLEEGEEIATNGTFSIDAAAQLAGKPSMMNPGPMIGEPDDENQNEDVEPEIQNRNDHSLLEMNEESYSNVLDDYLLLKNFLVRSENVKSRLAALQMMIDLRLIRNEMEHAGQKNIGLDQILSIEKHLLSIVDSEKIDMTRKIFKQLSKEYIVFVDSSYSNGSPIYVQHCPMADENKGAHWLSRSDEIRNPYFGDKMLKCGSVDRQILSRE